MSRMHFQEVRCRNCGHIGKINIWDSINVDSESKTKEEVKSLEFFKYTCPKCKESFQIEYLTVYNDTKNHFMIYYVPEEDIKVVDKIKEMVLPKKSEEKARIVFNKNDLLEKIAIFEARLNDVLIDLIKPFVISKVVEDGIDKEKAEVVYFSKYEDGKITFAFPEIENNFKVDIPVQLYEELWRRNKIKKTVGFTVINMDNAAEFLEK